MTPVIRQCRLQSFDAFGDGVLILTHEFLRNWRQPQMSVDQSVSCGIVPTGDSIQIFAA